MSEEATKIRRQHSRVWIAVGVAAVLGLAGGGVAWYRGVAGPGGSKGSTPATAEKYTCGMHPWILADKPGDCPVCYMKLTKIEAQAGAGAPAATGAPAPEKKADDFFADMGAKSAAAPGAERRVLFYRNPMNPMVTSPTPAKDEMGMDYVPVYADEAQAGGAGGGVEGLATVRASEDVLRRSGVQTAPAIRSLAGRTIRAVGIVVPDETRVRRVQTKVEGWVERLLVNFTGELVTAGQPLVSIYAPELLATQEEYLRARATAARFAASTDPAARDIGEDLVRSARRRLELFDVPEAFIRELEASGTPRKSVTLNAPFGGYVTAKEVFEGQKVEPGMELFTLTDLARVWVEVSLFEYEAAAAVVGQSATLTLPHQAGIALTGKVTFVSPVLSTESRALTVRLEFPNPGLALKPQMHVDVALVLDAAMGVVVPDAALLDTGVRTVVFVETQPGVFAPREVTVGARSEGRAEILAGLREGELVAVKANFLLDSESRLRAAIERMTAPPGGGK
ncbi:MAG TPA: efflux RND transporter periplasmic adaptor subunit [bacterium]